MSIIIIKLIALISMTVDHIGLLIFPSSLYLRFIGRMAFPIYCFLMVEGFYHIKDDEKRTYKYLLRLFICSLVTEVIFDLCLFNKFIYDGRQNALFILFLGLWSLHISNKLLKKGHKSFYPLIIFSFIAYYFKIDYGIAGMILIYAFYYGKKIKNKKKYYLYILASLLFMAFYEIFSSVMYLNNIIYEFKLYLWVHLGTILAIIPIYFYKAKDKINNKILKLSFYVYYPLHMLIIYLIKNFLIK